MRERRTHRHPAVIGDFRWLFRRRDFMASVLWRNNLYLRSCP